VEAGQARVPVMMLTYEDAVEGAGPVWIARSILTGHVAAGTTDDRARECLRRTIAGAIDLAARHGRSFEEWFRDQQPADPRFVEQYFDCASEVGRRLEWSPHPGSAVALAPG
jgi:hypothetical protein